MHTMVYNVTKGMMAWGAGLVILSVLGVMGVLMFSCMIMVTTEFRHLQIDTHRVAAIVQLACQVFAYALGSGVIIGFVGDFLHRRFCGSVQ